MTNTTEAKAPCPLAVMDFPTPKYRKGDVVWYASVNAVEGRHECPDCLGTKKWTCTSPAGHSMEMDCPRCDRNNCRDELSLSFTKYAVSVRPLTIGSTKIDTDESSDRGPVSYMCVETGVGSGPVYREAQLHPTKEKAEAEAAGLAAGKQAESDATPRAMQRLDYSRRPYLNAVLRSVELSFKKELMETLIVEGKLGEPTGGNWCVEKGYSEDSFNVVARGIGRHGDVKLCEVSGSDQYDHMPRAADALPNALLIAAAPRMKAALKSIAGGAEDAPAVAAAALAAFSEVQP